MTAHMKNSFLVISALILLTVPGCKHEQKTTTKINSNGSCERVIVIKSASDTASSFPLPSDTSWVTRIEGDSEKVFVASKKYDDVNEINNDYRIPGKISVEVKFEKRFRWFYTYFNYQETYKAYSSFHRISLISFLSKDEYEQYEKGDTSKAIKEKLDEFFMRNVAEEFYGQFVDSIESLRDPLLPVTAFQAKKTEFITGCIDIFKDKINDLEYLEKIVGIKLRGKVESQIEGIKKSIDKKVDYMMNAGGSYTNEVVMPGIILNTNASTVEGNKVSWKLDNEKFTYTDYIMIVESRSANPWVTYITGGALIMIVALLMVPRLRRK
jgi:hypothetical protein